MELHEKTGIAVLAILFGIFSLAMLQGERGITGFLIEGEKVSIPALPIVIVTALVDSINPCAIGVLIFLIGVLLTISKYNLRKMFFVGTIYIGAVYLTYLLAGLILLQAVAYLQGLGVAQIINVVVSVLVILMGLIELKDFFWYGKGITLSIPAKYSKKIKYMAQKVSVPGAIALGAFASTVELPCTGGPYLAITTILAKHGFDFTVFLYYLIYNFIFILPLIVILFAVYFGMDITKVKEWKESKKKWMRLWIGLILITLGVLLLLFSMGIINFSVSIMGRNQ